MPSGTRIRSPTSCFLACLLVVSAAGHAAVNPAGDASSRPEDLLASLRPEHPRLLASRSELERLAQRMEANPQASRWEQELRRQAERILQEPVSRYEIPDGLRLLSTSRRVLNRVYTLGLLHWIEQDPRYRERAWRELEAAAAFPDWNPRHFLDTAEMTHAFAIAYDWFFPSWSEAQRSLLRHAIVEKGLKPALEAHRGKRQFGWWTRSEHNWNQVCNGGIGMGALAVADTEPALAGELLAAAIKSIQLPMRRFAPDGGWDEGPGYWNYATTYNVVFLAALESALGTSFGLPDIPGFSEAGLFPTYITGPLGRTFNYADSGDSTIRAPQLFWMAARFGRPAYAAYERRVAAPHALDLLWGATASDTAAPALPLDRYFRGVEVVTMRSGWNDQNALFVGFKAGDNKAPHSNLDLGTFVLDALGKRWAVDLGADDYNLPGYFGGQRWTYYRLRAEGHNTLVIHPGPEPDQDPRAAATMTRFESSPERVFAVADLSPAYAGRAQRVLRGIAVLNRRAVLVQDEISADKPVALWWFLHTPSLVDLSADATSATLEQEGRRLVVRLLSPPGAKLSVLDARPLPDSPQPAKQAENRGIQKLAVHLSEVREARVAVLLTPQWEGGATPPMPGLRRLAEW